MFDNFDVIVVGAGPAGSSLSIRLADAGLRVCLLEERKFPRHKLCGEFISPECLRHFESLGVDERIKLCGAVRLHKTVFYAPSGRGFAVPSDWFGGAALGLSRLRMDDKLINQARKVGVIVRDETRALDFIFDKEEVVGVIAQNSSGIEKLKARLVVDATGRRRHLARKAMQRTGATKDFLRRASWVAFKAHLRGAKPDGGACEIYFYCGGYGGLSFIEDGLCNLCFIVHERDAYTYKGEAMQLMRNVVCSNARAAKTLSDAQVVSEWISTTLQSFGRSSLAPAKNLLTIGDAASFIDPFTGSGMLLALESSETLAQTIHTWWRSDLQAFFELERAYTQAYEKRFGWRLRWCAMLRPLAFASPRAVELGVALLGMTTKTRKIIAHLTRFSAQSP